MNSELVRLNTSNASHRLILIHGWGADAEDLLPIGQVLREKLNQKIEIVSLRAPQIHPEGVGRQWYPLFPADWDSVPSAIASLKDRLRAIATKKIPLEKSVLLGFSQGGAMALASGCDLPLAGLICCSGYPHPGWILPLQAPPMLITHGKYDEVVPLQAMEKIKYMLDKNNLKYDSLMFEGGHEIPEELILAFQKFLDEWLVI